MTRQAKQHILARICIAVLLGIIITCIVRFFSTERSASYCGPPEYSAIPEEALQVEESWKIEKVFNTKHGVMLVYDAAYCAEVWPETTETGSVIWDCRKSESDTEFVIANGWVDHSFDFEYGAFIAYGAPTEYDPDEDGWAKFLDANVENGKRYLYRVIQRKKDGTYTSSYIETMYWLERPAIETIQEEDGTVTLRWTQNTEADGYTVQYTAGDTVKRVRMDGNETVETTLSGLTAGETYEIRVRSWKVVDGTRYNSAKSAPETIEITG